MCSIPPCKTPIDELLRIATWAMSQPDHRAPKYRKHREAWVLAQFAVLYNPWPQAPSQLSFAEPGDSAGVPADFAIYGPEGKRICDLEVTELTDVWDWWKPGVDILEVDDPWAKLPELLSKKYGKAANYRPPTWLLIYDNVSSAIYQIANGVTFGASEKARFHLSKIDFAQSSIAAVWILSSDGRHAERLTGTPIILPTGG